MRDLLTSPAWEASELGTPLPVDKHAVSVCLPTWDSIIGYEEGLGKVTNKMQCGYPRFFKHPSINRLFSEAEETICDEGEAVVVFPNIAAAQRAQFFVEKRISGATRISSYEKFQCLVVPAEHFKIAMEYWRYTGEIVCSREAQDFFKGEQPAAIIPSEFRESIAEVFDCSAQDLFVYENGMAAAFAAFRSTQEFRAGKKTLQLEFPYVDVLKIQQHFGAGVVYLNECEDEPFEEALSRIQKGEFAGVFCEFPSNPLLRSVDLERISEACREGGVILIVDDTISSHFNVDVSNYADLITTSMTKWVSGKGDVMAGAVRVCPHSPLYPSLKNFFEQDNPSGSKLYAGDQNVLISNIDGFDQRMKIINENGLQLAQLLASHEAVDQVWYPSLVTADHYQSMVTEKGGFGGLISFSLKSPKKAPKVYDNLRMSKGPSLGNEFSLASPYTMLAHYDELEWAENCGVPASLIRISVGIEPLETLEAAVKDALAFA